MSGLNLLRYYKGNEGANAPGYAPTGLYQGTAAVFTEMTDLRNVDAEYDLKTSQRKERDNLFQAKTGIKVRRLGRDTLATARALDPKYGEVQEDHLVGGKYVNLPEYLEVYNDDRNSVIEDRFFTQQKTSLPDLSDMRLNADINQYAIEQAQKAKRTSESVIARNTSPIASSLIGGLTGGLTDKTVLATLPIGAGETKIVGVGGLAVARAIALQAAKEGIIQAAVQSAGLPQVAAWHKETGFKYGLSEMATDTAFAFAGGALVRAGAEGFMPAVRGLRRGADGVSSYMLDKIETAAPRASQTVRDAIKYMARDAYVDEAAPVPLRNTADLQEHRAAAQKVADDINNYHRPSTELPGISRIVTPRNELELEVKGRLVELDDLTTSDKPGFDQSLQPRDRANRVASDVRINEIAARLDPAQLGESRVSNTGAPVVGPDMMVESGNGRVMALKKVYEAHPENAKRYRDFLEAQGYDTTGFKNPILIRQRVSELTPEQRKQFVIYSNEDVADRLSTTERALADAKLMTHGIVQGYKGGDVDNAINADFVRNFIDTAVSPAERNSFLTPGGKLSQDGAKRIRAAMLARAYSDSDLVQRLLEDADTNIKTIGDVLMNLAGDWSKLRANVADGNVPPMYDITKDLMDAVNTVVNARNEARPITDYVNQRGLFAETDLTAETNAILRGLYNEKMTRPLGYDKTRDFLAFYVREAGKVNAGPDLLGEKAPDPMNILEAALKKTHEKDNLEMSFDLGGSPEVRAVREAGLQDLVKGVKHPGNGMTFFKALEEMARRPETIKDKGFKSAKRKAVREKIQSDLIAEQKAKTGGDFAKDKIAEIVLGPPGAGKSSVLVKRLQSDLKAVIVDSDMVKEKMPEFDNGLGANAVHEESKVVTQDWLDDMILDGANIIHPIVGANADKVGVLVDSLSRRGYTVNIRLVQISSTESLTRVINRFAGPIEEGGGRLVPPSYVMSIGDGPIKTFDIMKQREGINAYSYFDNNVKIGQEPRIVESNDPRFIASQETRPGLRGDGSEAGPQRGGTEQIDPEKVNAFFDDNAYRLREYRDPPVAPPSEVKPSDRMAASQAQFAELLKENPEMLVTLDDGSSVRLADYAARMKEDQNVLEALTTCRLS